MPDNDKKSFADFSGDLKQFAPCKSSKSGLSFWKMYYEASWSKLLHTSDPYTCCHGLQPSDNQGKLLSLSTGFLVYKT